MKKIFSSKPGRIRALAAVLMTFRATIPTALRVAIPPDLLTRLLTAIPMTLLIGSLSAQTLSKQPATLATRTQPKTHTEAAQPTASTHYATMELPPGQPPRFDSILYGAAYYYEYRPEERLDKDVQLMKEAGINTVRIAESTWAVWEPRDGVYDFSKLDRVLDAMGKAGIHVIIGTPTYAIPAWLAREHPEVLVTTAWGKAKYGARQNMDIVSPVFRQYAERIIRQLVRHVRDRSCVIGYQADNETKAYGNMGQPIQALFAQWLQQQFGTPEKMNRAYGLNYWSNSIHDWKDFPSMTGNINASLGCAFSEFQRKMVTDYLAWQVGIIRGIKRPDQFITQNFDLEWRGVSYGIQPDVDHFAAARAFDVAGIDIYHPTQDRLTGAEISFGGDLARGMKRANYLLMETQAQSLAGHQELPYPGQLRLQAFSHLASGANMVEYWPWQSIPNAVETYWKGVLSHDGESNPLYEEARGIGADLRKHGNRLVGLQKKNKVAILFSNESLTALSWFPFSDSLTYNDILRREYDALYEMNIGCDLVNTSSRHLEEYALLIVPPLYSASDSVLSMLNAYVRQGGHIVYSCKSGFTDQHVQVRSSRMPGPLREAAGISYQEFTNIGRLPLKGELMTGAAGSAGASSPDANEAHDWAELLTPETAHVLASYDHPYWGKYAAITRNRYGKGVVTYLGTIPSKALLHTLLAGAVKEAGAGSVDQELSYPLVVKSGINQYGKTIHYYFNYSGVTHTFRYPYPAATELLTGRSVGSQQELRLEPWGLLVLEEEGKEDTDGHFINAHGAGVLFHDGVYYLFGEIKKGPTHLVPGQDWEDYRVDAGGVSCYSSRDLVHWKNEGVALAATRGDTSSDLDIGRVIERPKVIYNEATKQFVLWMHIDREDYSYSRAGVAVSDRPQGPYHYLGSVRPNGQMARDMTVFRDEDGRAFLVYSSENNNTMQVCLLSPDYLSPTTTYKRILIGQRREAPAVFRTGGHYYLITSLCSGWDPNAATYAVADSMLGDWQQRGNPCVGPGAATTFLSQSTYVLPLEGSFDPRAASALHSARSSDKPSGSFLFMADRWNKTDLERSGYLWLPLRMEDGKPIIREESATGSTGAASSANTTGTERIWQRLPVAPLSIINYEVKVRAGAAASLTNETTSGTTDHHITAYSFIRFYDSTDRQLLEYKIPVTVSKEYTATGNYTETPATTSYITVGIGSDAAGELPEATDWHIDTHVGTPDTPHAPLCNIDQYLQPFWGAHSAGRKGDTRGSGTDVANPGPDTVYNETVLLLSQEGKPALGRLLYTPDKIVSVRSFDLGTGYRKGADYRVKGRTLVRSATSGMPFRADTSFDRTKDLAWYNLQSQWVVVTYTHRDSWKGPVPVYKGDRLPRLMEKLRTGRPVNIVAYGMSLTRGMDVSGYDQVAPYMPTYMELLAAGLRNGYHHSSIRLYNAGLPGSTVSWGASYAEEYINPLHPDLVVLDFGMNDFWRMPPEEFRDSIKTILRKVQVANPTTEFLLLANMKFDPDYVLDSDKNKPFYTGNMIGYQHMLEGLESDGIISLDMTTLSDAIYRQKKAKDCIANPLHPNDYMARWYAQGMLALLGLGGNRPE